MQRNLPRRNYLGPGADAPAERMRRARMRNFFMRQDIFFTFNEWPEWVQDLILEGHHKRRARYSLFFFLVANGLNPEIAIEWIKAIDYHNGRLVSGAYTQKHEKHFHEMLGQTDPNSPSYMFKGEKPIKNLYTGRVEKF